MDQDNPSNLPATTQGPTPPARIDATDAELHDLMQHVAKHQTGSTPSRLVAGARVPIKAIKLLIQNPKMLPLVAIPVAINFTLVLGALFLIVPQAAGLLGSIWAYPEVTAWYMWLMRGLWWIAYALSIAVSVIFSYISAMLVGGVIASPFNDMISERTEKILLGSRYVPGPDGAFWAGVGRSILSSLATTMLYVAVMAPLFLLNLIPAVGSIAYTLLGAVVGGYFLALEYSDILLERKNFAFRQKLELVWKERTMTLGFGIGTSLMLAVPLLNFLCIPIAVIGGTALGLGLEQWHHYPAQDDKEAAPRKELTSQGDDA